MTTLLVQWSLFIIVTSLYSTVVRTVGKVVTLFCPPRHRRALFTLLLPNWVKNDTKSNSSADAEPDLSSTSARSDLPRSPPAASRAPPAAAPAALRAIGPSIGSPTEAPCRPKEID